MDDRQKPTAEPPQISSLQPGGSLKSRGSSFSDLFFGGTSVWLKIVGGAIIGPVVVGVVALRSGRRGRAELPVDEIDPMVVVYVLATASLLGAVLGGTLAMKDIVQARLADGKRVALPLKLVFGLGMWSLLLVWVPLLIVGISIALAMFL